ncbi:HlyD family efflux transporter periplasmic adaptor subunit [Microbulbifer sp. OS29]|uniref:HlyD family efflux transporter periplasmic adaptor subunit n=1 Tax=Microbulbifer okhotskensis TaxID=2926617 RepID=A0A9X2J6U8_9GAMM|nr:HlyD family efflux transporter periplasmic adaptor subunit [Microbulbifer okhotskensis]MCO1335804.1 HlyD family efflux transporter periplasmic adaptor subunit [Microbulbifer okhotskensis]
MAAWALWFFTQEITTYSVSDQARLEQEHNTVHVSTQREGRVVSILAVLGDTLNSGDLLVKLDTSSFDLDLTGDGLVLNSLSAQLESIKLEQSLIDNKYVEDDKALQDQLQIYMQKYQLQQSNQKIQADVTNRYEMLLEKQQSSELDYLAAKRTYQQMAMETLQVKSEIELIKDRLEQISHEYQLEVSTLQQRRANIEQKLVETDTRIQQSSLAVNEQELRAPISGTLASLAEIREGEVLQAGQHIATIQAGGGISVQAFFPPALALGHIQVGQVARVKLDGFSWARYGQFEARVERMASAVQHEKILVQLSLQGDAPSILPLLHDLPARVEIATGTKTPYQLLLQRVGDMLTEDREIESDTRVSF